MSLTITVTDNETGDTDAVVIAEGDYLLICAEPCHRVGVKAYPTESKHVITVAGHNPKHPPRPAQDRRGEGHG